MISVLRGWGARDGMEATGDFVNAADGTTRRPNNKAIRLMWENS